MDNESISSDVSCCNGEKVVSPRGKAPGRKLSNAKTPHPDHAPQLKKLNRVVGQLQGVKRMIEQRRYCPEILTQTRAAASALKMVEMGIIETHLRHCVSEALTSKNSRQAARKVEELVSVLGRF